MVPDSARKKRERGTDPVLARRPPRPTAWLPRWHNGERADLRSATDLPELAPVVGAPARHITG